MRRSPVPAYQWPPDPNKIIAPCGTRSAPVNHICPTLTEYRNQLNDLLPEGRDLRQNLPAMEGTDGDGQQEARQWIAADWVIRTATPLWLDTANQPEHATRLRDLTPIVDCSTRNAAWPVLCEIRGEMWTLRNARLKEIHNQATAAVVVDAVADAIAGAAHAAAVAVGHAHAAVAVGAADAIAGNAVSGHAAGWAIHYGVAYKVIKARVEERYADVLAELHTQAIVLLGRMIRP